MKLIFLASPLKGDMENNIKKAREYSKYIVEQGHIPFAPHLLFTQFLDDTNPEERKIGISMGFKFMEFCDELWIFGDTISEGMKGDIEEFKKMNKPIRYINI